MVLVCSLIALAGNWQGNDSLGGIKPKEPVNEPWVCSSDGRSPINAGNHSESSRPLPKVSIVRQGMHPNPGPGREDHSRGQRESVLGKEIGVDDAYTREPMSNLVVALGTKRTIDDVIKVRCEAKQITDDKSEHLDARIVPAPRKCIQARNGTTSEQREHRSMCHNEECIIAFRIHGLWSERPGQAVKRDRSSRGLNPHAIEFTPSEAVGLINPRSSACTPSHYTSLPCMGTKTKAEANDAEVNDAEGNDAKAIQDADSSGVADPTATLSSGGCPKWRKR
jgi:hypothetical protein